MSKARRMTSAVRVSGPLEVFGAGFGEELAALGYTPLSAANQLRVVAHLSRWLDRKNLHPGELSPGRVEEFLADRRAAGYTCWRSGRGLAPLLGYLRRLGVVPEPVVAAPGGALEVLVGSYESYLAAERGLAAATVQNCIRVARRFLAWSAARHGEPGIGELGAADVRTSRSSSAVPRTRGQPSWW